MQPIRAKLGDVDKQLLISPDSQLNLIPFAALVDENNQYLVENYDISYLSSGRDLLRLSNLELQYQPKQGPLLVANPDYANPGTPTIAQDPRKGGFNQSALTQTKGLSSKPAPTQAPTSPRPNLGEGPGERASLAQAKTSISDPGQPNRRSSDLNRSFNNFTPLPGTAEEARIIGQRLPNATVLTDTHATENAIKAVQAPSILHIATHGFFLNDLPQPEAKVGRGFGGFGEFRAGLKLEGGNFGNAPLAPSFSAQNENPLLRSGLALAGFNQRSSGTEDGVLTALEAANLNLRGTQLVVLSACDTGLGDIANGEGVYGLRRAFVMAGAETQLISLWKVDDIGTKDLMVSYYDKLIAGDGRADALHQTQRELLTGKYSHPYYWASFISSGDWRPLEH